MLDLTPHTPEEAEEHCFRTIILPSQAMHETLKTELINTIENTMSSLWIIRDPSMYQTRVDNALAQFNARSIRGYVLPHVLYSEYWKAKAHVWGVNTQIGYSFWLECVGVPLDECKGWSGQLRSELVERRLKKIQNISSTPSENLEASLRQKIANNLKAFVGSPITPALRQQMLETCRQTVAELGGENFQVYPTLKGVLGGEASFSADFPNPMPGLANLTIQSTLEIR